MNRPIAGLKWIREPGCEAVVVLLVDSNNGNSTVTDCKKINIHIINTCSNIPEVITS